MFYDCGKMIQILKNMHAFCFHIRKDLRCVDMLQTQVKGDGALQQCPHKSLNRFSLSSKQNLIKSRLPKVLKFVRPTNNPFNSLTAAMAATCKVMAEYLATV